MTRHKIILACMAASTMLGGCASMPGGLASSGPSTNQITSSNQVNSGVQIVDVDGQVTRQLQEINRREMFSETLAGAQRVAGAIGLGDVLEISVWEAPPATLFAATTLDPRVTVPANRATVLIEQVVSADGSVNVPFAGAIHAEGKLPKQIEAEIVKRLAGKAHHPQVVVRITRNVSAAVTVLGDVNQSSLVPLTARGERVLDVIAAAGGVRQPVNKVMVQVTRGEKVRSLPMDTVIQNPRENVILAPGDVVTAQFQPNSFSVLGATGKNEEINFEAQGISLAQALARSGGFQDQRADAMGVFVFRMESPGIADDPAQPGAVMIDGKVPTIYRVNMKDPASFLLAQSFPIRNKDVLYVSNAPASELQKFLNILSTALFPVNLLN